MALQKKGYMGTGSQNQIKDTDGYYYTPKGPLREYFFTSAPNISCDGYPAIGWLVEAAATTLYIKEDSSATWHSMSHT